MMAHAAILVSLSSTVSGFVGCGAGGPRTVSSMRARHGFRFLCFGYVLTACAGTHARAVGVKRQGEGAYVRAVGTRACTRMVRMVRVNRQAHR